MSLINYIVFLTKIYVINLLSLLIISISLNICSRNSGYMNLCQLGFFGDKQQKPTLVNLSKKGYLGKDVEQQEKKKPQRTKCRSG